MSRPHLSSHPPPPPNPSTPSPDLTLLVQQHQFHVHTSLLQTRSPVFAHLLGPNSNFTTNEQEVMNLPGEEPSVVEGVIKFLYTGDYDLPSHGSGDREGGVRCEEDYAWHVQVNDFAERFRMFDLAHLSLCRFRELAGGFLGRTGRVEVLEAAGREVNSVVVKGVIDEVVGRARRGATEEGGGKRAWVYDGVGGGGELQAVWVWVCDGCGRRGVSRDKEVCCRRVVGGVMCWIGGEEEAESLRRMVG